MSPTSLSATIGRPVVADDVVIARLDGYGRRWNYGSLNLRGDWHHDGVAVTQGLVVSLGLVAADAENCNGVIVRVTTDELARLDWRERDYDRTDVTDRIRPDDADHAHRIGWVVTYVPRPRAVARYESARDCGRAAVRRTYWDLVAAAFADLGDEHLARYESTPAPDVPVVDMSTSQVP